MQIPLDTDDRGPKSWKVSSVIYEGDYEHAREWASAQWDLLRIQQIRSALLKDLDRGQPSFEHLKLLLATSRYDHRARTRRRRAAAKLKGDPA